MFETIQKQNPDLLALQETTLSQLDEVKNQFSNKYKIIDLKNFTPDSVILFKKNRFKIIERGHWFLGKVSEVKMRRLAIWVKLKDLTSSREIMFISVHVDANKIKGTQIKLINSRLSKDISSQAPIFIAGDFNTDPQELEFELIFSKGLIDSHPGKKDNKNSYTFPYKSPIRRIDHILYSGVDVKVDNWTRLEKHSSVLISDHYPVVAEFTILPRKRVK